MLLRVLSKQNNQRWLKLTQVQQQQVVGLSRTVLGTILMEMEIQLKMHGKELITLNQTVKWHKVSGFMILLTKPGIT